MAQVVDRLKRERYLREVLKPPLPHACSRCKGERVVCAEHDHTPWGGGYGCCGQCGIDCPTCSPRGPTPELP